MSLRAVGISNRSSNAAVVMACCALVAALALLGNLGNAARGETVAQTADTPAVAEPDISDRDATEIPEGGAEADDDAADATTAIELAPDRSMQGAVEAFVAYATWAIASPAAAADPMQAAEALGGDLNPADEAMVESVDRESVTDFVPSDGAYRVLAHAGDEAAPTQVMIEVVAPIVVDGRRKWTKVGGVVAWEDGWSATSMRPSEVAQPDDPTGGVASMSAAQQAVMLDGLGWQTFANSAVDN